MAEIIFNDVTLRYPIYSANAMSLRSQLVKIATGGTIDQAGNKTVITALKNVSFKLTKGDSVGIIGHNGAGKSTLLRTIAGIYQPQSGTITRTGKIATVFEIGAGLEPELSGYDNIINLGMIMGLTYKEAQAITPAIEAFTELGDFLKLPVRTYSSGMTMRLMFAVATSITPEILLIDEMFATGDEGFKEKCLSRIKELIATAHIFVFASHDQQLIETYCNRIFRLEHGTLEEVTLKREKYDI
jgi:ABC-type polysaccharide/polyol phosphate transport system ATPase subunit